MGEEKKRIPEMFGSMVFGDEVMKARLPKEIYEELHRTMAEGRRLSAEAAEIIAGAMKEWAVEKGATHYTHWFQPLTGITAEKHVSFISPDGKGGILLKFSGKELIKGEPDASSFPSGGIRSTFEARGYTAWDPSAYAFIKDNTLCIPTVFYAYGGEALDKKTPLLRSLEAVNREGLKLLRLLGKEDVKRIRVNVGAEQEYFLISRKKYYQRPDLVITGRTLFGSRPPKGQEMEDHYFGTIKPRVAAFMRDLDEELWKLGILADTEHNEAAPAQHELAPIFTDVNTAIDHNQLTMEIMKKVARRHELACLLHEKPFAGVNGSGKHNNWSLSTDTGVNLLDPGDSPQENAQFLLFLAALIRAVDEYADLLRASVSGAGNDQRLGGDEAPPAIISMFLGEELTGILETIERGEAAPHKDRELLKVGVHILPRFAKDTTDRNRTSPFTFSINKFEFRMPGSGQSIASPNVVLNTAVAEVLRDFARKIEQSLAAGTPLNTAIETIVRETYAAHKRIVFNGNNYSDEWREEAKRRGLPAKRSTAEAMEAYLAPKNISLFLDHKIFSEVEIRSRYEITLESYVKVLAVEAQTMIDMARREILPAASRYTDELLSAALHRKELLGSAADSGQEARQAKELSLAADEAYDALLKLEKVMQERPQGEDLKKETIERIRAEAGYFHEKVLPAMEALRAAADLLERQTAEDVWPFPTYSKLLFYV